MTDAERQRAEYQRRKVSGLCVDCGAVLLEDDGLSCCDCADRARVYRARWTRTPRARRLARLKEKRRYASPEFAEVKRRQMRERYQRLKETGVCVRCGSAPQRETNLVCAKCDSGVPRRSLKARPGLVPLVEPEASWSDRVLVAMRFLGWSTTGDVADHMGCSFDAATDRNSVQVSMARLVKRGLIERRIVASFKRLAEYQLSPADKAAADAMRKREAA